MILTKNRGGISTLVMLVTLTVIMSICFMTGEGYARRLRQFRNEERLAQVTQICDGMARRIQGIDLGEVSQETFEWDFTPMERSQQSAPVGERWQGVAYKRNDHWEITATIRRGDTILAKKVREIPVNMAREVRDE